MHSKISGDLRCIVRKALDTREIIAMPTFIPSCMQPALTADYNLADALIPDVLLNKRGLPAILCIICEAIGREAGMSIKGQASLPVLREAIIDQDTEDSSESQSTISPLR